MSEIKMLVKPVCGWVEGGFLMVATVKTKVPVIKFPPNLVKVTVRIWPDVLQVVVVI